MSKIEIPSLSHPLNATVDVPGCKSITNRALVIAALAQGDSFLEKALFSEDTDWCERCLQKLNIPVISDPVATSFAISGRGGQIPATQADLFVGNAGTAARFLTALVVLGHGDYRFDGIPRMRQRPMGDMLTVLQELGTPTTFEGEAGFMPYTLHSRGFAGGHIQIKADKTSQQLSGLLIIAPYAQQDTTIEVVGELVSKPYIEITLQVMRDFGVEVTQHGWEKFVIPAGQVYQGRNYLIEPDASNASYFFAAAAVTGGRVRVNGLTKFSGQGDAQFVQVLAQMGCQVTATEHYTELQGPSQLHGLDIDLNGMSDMVPTLAAIAPFADSPVTIRNVEHIRWKETERIKAVVTELERMGAQVEEFRDGLTVYPSALHGAEIETYNDHRMAMAFAVTGLRVSGVVIKEPECTGKTFPDYFEQFSKMIKA